MHEVIFDYKLPERCNDRDFLDVLHLTQHKLKTSWSVRFTYHLEGWQRNWRRKRAFLLHQRMDVMWRFFSADFCFFFFLGGGWLNQLGIFLRGKEIKNCKYQVYKGGIGLLQDSTVIACRVDVYWLGVGLDSCFTLFFLGFAILFQQNITWEPALFLRLFWIVGS